jgi:hypothetical protein
MNSNAALPSPELTAIRVALQEHERPIVLLEGTRDLPDANRPQLVVLAALLAREFPKAIFRTGSANGWDEAFAHGVAQVDAARLEYAVPYATHRAGVR